MMTVFASDVRTLLVLGVTLLGCYGYVDAVTCWDYCSGDDDPTSYCSDRHTQNTCEGVACKITRVVDTDILDRECVVENDALGVYPGYCWAGVYNGDNMVSCQYSCENVTKCNQNFEEVQCWNYCEGTDDKTGFCDSRRTKNTCTGVTCRKTNWKGSDVYDRSCVTENDKAGVHHEACFDAVFDGNNVNTCQCRSDNCNSGNNLNAGFVNILLTLGCLTNLLIEKL